MFFSFMAYKLLRECGHMWDSAVKYGHPNKLVTKGCSNKDE